MPTRSPRLVAMNIKAKGNIVGGNGYQHIGPIIYDSHKPLSPEEEEEKIARVLLESLRFPSMEDRYNDIRDPYPETFQWIFHDPKERNKNWDNFAEWLGKQRLGENDGLYWIEGKAGSGKSTLMRYLFKNTQTRVLLQKWSCAEDEPQLFNDNPKLQLQALTSDGIKLYVSGTLHEDKKMKALYHDENEEALKLEEEIVSAADGVFLWVELILKSLIIGLGNLDDIAQLRERFSRMPPEIEGLYKYMLKDIDTMYANDAVHIFRIMSVSQQDPPKRPILLDIPKRTFRIPQLTALELSFALDKNQDFATNPTTPISQEDLKTRIKRVDIQLRKCCAGLLELSGYAYYRRYEVRVDSLEDLLDNPSAYIQYHHRTAKDFLDGEGVQGLIVEPQQGDQFSPSAALVRGWLVIYQTLCTPILKRLKNNTTALDRSLLRSIDATLILARRAEIETGRAHVEDIDRLNTTIEGLWHSSHRTTRHWGEHISFDPRSDHPDYWHDDFLGAVVAYGLHHYVAQKLGDGNSILRKKLGRPYLEYALDHSLISAGFYSPDMVKVLLAHGAEPNRTIKGTINGARRRKVYNQRVPRGGVNRDWFEDRSPWEKFLENGLIYPETEQIMELLLQHGAEPSLAVEAVEQTTRLDRASKEKLLTLISNNQQPTLLQRVLQLVHGA
ncbi:hypothetical protein V496_06431 [Pseudogymnoascus sp. VKM F-4515 (FW-2607)]|nr:hypothetical protein V496_06431 [Pseudogymnoascus sp. VKM F-4515 (FW-2607)]